MSIGSIILKPGSFTQHLVAHQHKRERAQKSLMAVLTLTAMVDMFAVLVIFLLQSFSASPELLVTKGVQLPAAITGAEIKDAPVLSLVAEKVYLDQQLIGESKAVLENPELLTEKLAAIRKKWQIVNQDKAFPGEINLQADRAIPSTLVSRFMGILSNEHFGSILLAVVGEHAGTP